jgi:thiol-disulfide isomerase/thioredoxin
MDDIDFKTKYLMYKAKYLSLKNKSTLEPTKQTGGGENSKDDIILFKSENCGHCKRFKPTWEVLEKQFTCKHNFITYDYEKNPDKMKEFNINGVPTIYRISGENKYMFEGERDLDNLVAFLS